MRIFSFGEKIYEIGLSEIEPGDNNYYWFDLTPEELRALNKDLFKFQLDSIIECENMKQLAKVDFFDEYTFLVLNSLKYESGIVHPDEFNIFLSRTNIVTVSRESVKIIRDMQSSVMDDNSTVLFSKGRSPSKLLYILLDRLILSDYDIINKLENSADLLEIQILKKPNKQFLAALLHLRHQVHTLRRCIAPLRYIGDNLLCNENGIIEKEYLKYYHQINSKIEKLMFALESLIQYIVLVREAFEAEMSNKTNEFMRLFTTVSMFFAPLTLITGIYNMNFKIPEYNWEHGYAYCLVLMASVSIAMFVYFKKKNWL